ncbi:MAG TPA: response regulator [Vicinamibacteria bacterium]|nr:response regulator [Vicinamibacteria bacterium]
MVVVDDDSKVRLLLERAFRAPEFETHAFPTGAAALRRVAEIRPDCVVSDILMPDMDGEGLLRAVRTVPGLERVPFIAVSAVRSEARIRTVLEAGADAFLLKPFPLRDLIEKVRSLLGRPAAARSGGEKTSDYTSPTRPVLAAAHTMSTAAIRRRPGTARFAPPRDTPILPPVAPPGVPPVPPRTATPPAALPAAPPVRPPAAPAPPRGPTTTAAPTSVHVAPVRIVVPTPAAERADVHRTELGPPDGGLGFGRFTRVDSRGRSFVVLTEAVAQPKFTVTTVITENGIPLRKIESALPHPLAREDDGGTVRRQLDLQHDDTLRRLSDLVLDHTPRRVVWSDQSRSVEAGVLAWAMSAVAQLAESEAGTDETARQLRLTRESALVEESALRAFHVTPFGRVMVDPEYSDRLPRRAVRAIAAWCRAFATAVLQVEPDRVVEPVRQATRRYALELERMGFYDRLARRAKA